MLKIANKIDFEDKKILYPIIRSEYNKDTNKLIFFTSFTFTQTLYWENKYFENWKIWQQMSFDITSINVEFLVSDKNSTYENRVFFIVMTEKEYLKWKLKN